MRQQAVTEGQRRRRQRNGYMQGKKRPWEFAKGTGARAKEERQLRQTGQEHISKQESCSDTYCRGIYLFISKD